MTTVFNLGPVPAYTNPPIQPDLYEPSQFYIQDITLGVTTIVTVDGTIDCVIGNKMRLIIYPQNGCVQLNGVEAYVLSLPASNQVELALNSSVGVSPFTSSSYRQQPQIICIADINSGCINASGRTNLGLTIPGAFIALTSPRT